MRMLVIIGSELLGTGRYPRTGSRPKGAGGDQRLTPKQMPWMPQETYGFFWA